MNKIFFVKNCCDMYYYKKIINRARIDLKIFGIIDLKLSTIDEF